MPTSPHRYLFNSIHVSREIWPRRFWCIFLIKNHVLVSPISHSIFTNHFYFSEVPQSHLSQPKALHQLRKLGFWYMLTQLLSPSTKMSSPLLIPSFVLFHFPFFPRLTWPPELVWMPSDLIWDLSLIFPFDCVFGLTSLIPNSLWLWNIQVSPHLTTL